VNDPMQRLIVALDVPDGAAARAAVSRLRGHVGWFKIGLELFVREGPELVREVVGSGCRVFLDLKVHDIPNTAAGAVRSACMLGAGMLTVHASGGPAMLKAAADAAGAASNPPLLLGVTALTSLSHADMGTIGVPGPVPEWVERLAGIAWGAGLKGLVASPHEAAILKKKYGSELRLVVPGIRPGGAPLQDQARAMTPGEAIGAGADYLVVGRPILKDSDPVAAADRIVAEIAAAAE
jgi:orotidine-5'-phosphate decarboxylase